MGKMDSNKITVKSLSKPSAASLSFNRRDPPDEKLPRLKPKVFSKRAHTTPLMRPKDDTGVNEDMVEKQWEEKVSGSTDVQRWRTEGGCWVCGGVGFSTPPPHTHTRPPPYISAASA